VTVNDTLGVTEDVTADLASEVVDAELVEDEEQDEDQASLVDDEAKAPEVPAKPKGKRATKKEADAKTKAAKPGKKVAVVEKSSFTRAQAEAKTKKLRDSVENAGELLIEVYTGRVWLALVDSRTGEPYSKGAAGWQEYLDDRLGDLRPRLSVDKRRELVAKMTYEGKMSTRAIAGALGMDQKTISNDRQALDGALKVDAERGEGVVGVDGVERSGATRETTRKPKPVEDRFSAVVEKLDKYVGDLVELTNDEGFEEAVGEIAKRHLADLQRFITEVESVKAQLQ
jgi:hypothetical protein